jgi:hypothetical protein
LLFAFMYGIERWSFLLPLTALLSIDNFYDGFERASTLAAHGTLANCLSSGSMAAHALLLGLQSAALATAAIAVFYIPRLIRRAA